MSAGREQCGVMARAVRQFTIEVGLMIGAQTLTLMALILIVRA